MQKLAADLKAHPQSKVVLVGDAEPAAIQELAEALGATLGRQSFEGDLQMLADDLEAGSVKHLFILGGNPVYSASEDLRFAERIANAGFSVHLSLYQDETSQRCRWHLPETHFLEAWSDLLASTGTPTILQPVIDPLYAGRSIQEVLAMLTENFSAVGLRDRTQDVERRAGEF